MGLRLGHGRCPTHSSSTSPTPPWPPTSASPSTGCEAVWQQADSALVYDSAALGAADVASVSTLFDWAAGPSWPVHLPRAARLHRLDGRADHPLRHDRRTRRSGRAVRRVGLRRRDGAAVAAAERHRRVPVARRNDLPAVAERRREALQRRRDQRLLHLRAGRGGRSGRQGSLPRRAPGRRCSPVATSATAASSRSPPTPPTRPGPWCWPTCCRTRRPSWSCSPGEGIYPGIDVTRTSPAVQARFAAVPVHPSVLPLAELTADAQPELDGRYLTRIEQDWTTGPAAAVTRRPRSARGRPMPRRRRVRGAAAGGVSGSPAAGPRAARGGGLLPDRASPRRWRRAWAISRTCPAGGCRWTPTGRSSTDPAVRASLLLTAGSRRSRRCSRRSWGWPPRWPIRRLGRSRTWCDRDFQAQPGGAAPGRRAVHAAAAVPGWAAVPAEHRRRRSPPPRPTFPALTGDDFGWGDHRRVRLEGNPVPDGGRRWPRWAAGVRDLEDAARSLGARPLAAAAPRHAAPDRAVRGRWVGAGVRVHGRLLRGALPARAGPTRRRCRWSHCSTHNATDLTARPAGDGRGRPDHPDQRG